MPFERFWQDSFLVLPARQDMTLNDNSYEENPIEALIEFLILAGVTFLPFDVLLADLPFFFFI